MQYQKCKKLLDKSNESFYWLGYLASDGSFKLDGSNNLSRISFNVNDECSVLDFKKFLGVKNKITNYGKSFSITIMDRYTCQKLIDLYKISTNKTYNPMKVRDLTEDQFASYLIGFIDGDGCIKLQSKRITPRLSIKCHSSWLPELKYWHSNLEKFTGELIARPKINKAGYSVWNISSLLILKYLKLKSRKLLLPCLQRKWRIIDLKVVNSANIRELQRRYLRIEIPKLKHQGMNYKEIASKLKIQPTRVYQYTNFK